MPDRDDVYVNDDRQILPTDQSYSVPTPVNLAPTYNHNKRFDPETEHQLADFSQFPSNDPFDIAVENQHLDKTFVAYSKEYVQRVVTRPILPISGLLIGGEVNLAGISLYHNGTDLVILRDGIDASAPVAYLLGANTLTNQWWGTPGLRFANGLYVQFPASTTFANGAVQIVQDYSV